jgi:hypothetical protein
MNGQWFEQVKEVCPMFPEQYRGKDVNELLFWYAFGSHATSSYTPIGHALNQNSRKTREAVLSILLSAGANPSTVCVVKNTLDEQRVYSPLEYTRFEYDARTLLQAGATLPSYRHTLWANFMSTEVSKLVFNFYDASFRATAVVWCCCDGLRATSSWPDMAFLLTCIMMDVSSK